MSTIKLKRFDVSKIKKRDPPPNAGESSPENQTNFLNGWFGSFTVSPSSSAFSATMISIMAAAGAIIFAFSIGPYRYRSVPVDSLCLNCI